MIVTVFRSRLRPGFQDEYVALVDRMQQIAKSIPGYISHKGFWAWDRAAWSASRSGSSAVAVRFSPFR